ncbi:Uncharacterised protein [Vibrio cholerae]|nr:Uncharacterised protein [Vibrio cholerae]
MDFTRSLLAADQRGISAVNRTPLPQPHLYRDLSRVCFCARKYLVHGGQTLSHTDNRSLFGRAHR